MKKYALPSLTACIALAALALPGCSNDQAPTTTTVVAQPQVVPPLEEPLVKPEVVAPKPAARVRTPAPARQPRPQRTVEAPPAVQPVAPVEPTVPEGVKPVGRLMLVKGEVLLKRAGSKRGRQATVGDDVYLNDHITTSGSGFARMHLRDESVLRIAPASEMAVTTQLLGEEDTNTTIDLLKGKLRSIVVRQLGANSSFEVHTAVAVAGVRGTDFEVIVGETTLVQCFTGAVVIAAADPAITQTVVITPNTYTEVAKALPPTPPEPLLEHMEPLEDPEPIAPLLPPEVTGPTPAKRKAQTVSPGQAEAIIQQHYNKTQESLQQGPLIKPYEKDPAKPLQQQLYGDGINGWVDNPAR